MSGYLKLIKELKKNNKIRFCLPRGKLGMESFARHVASQDWRGFVSGMGWHMGERKEKTEIGWHMKDKRQTKEKEGERKRKEEEVGN